MRIGDEELVQYLLGEADSGLREQVESALAAHAQLAKRLEELRAALGLLDGLSINAEPPSDLVERTMLRIDAETADAANVESCGSGDAAGSCEGPLVHSRRASNSITASAPRSHRQWWDSAILSLSIVAICSLLLPLVLEARSQSRRLQCAYNLSSLGRGLTELAMLDSERRFPSVPASGPEAFAGIMAVRLHDASLLDSASLLKCASLPKSAADSPCLMRIPSREEFYDASADQRQLWRCYVGGDYAYNLGVIDGGRVTGPKLEGRTHFAILADAPRIENDHEAFVAHEGLGVNIYYEDGHVAFVPVKRAKPLDHTWQEPALTRRTLSGGLKDKLTGDKVLPVEAWPNADDDPFRNNRGLHACGLNPDDAVLGPSYSSPLPGSVNLP